MSDMWSPSRPKDGMPWVPLKSLTAPLAQPGPAPTQEMYPPPPTDEWCARYPTPDAEFILRLELALHNEAQPARRRAIIQRFLDQRDDLRPL